MVLAAGRGSSPSADAALADLCQRYWLPLYVFARRRIVNQEEARDLTQEFFARLLEKNTLALANPERGRFRSFLLTALNHFLSNEWDKVRAKKRGGGRTALTLDFEAHDSRMTWEPVHGWTPERLYERQWALTLLDRALSKLRAEYVATDKLPLFEHLKASLTGENVAIGNTAAGRRLNMTAGAIKVAAHRLRRRYREMLRQEVAETLASEADVDDEIRGLFHALGDSCDRV